MFEYFADGRGSLQFFALSHYFAEVKIKGYDHARLSDRLVENLTVGQALQSFVSEMGRIVPLRV